MTIEGCDKLIARLKRAEQGLQADKPGALHNFVRDTWQVGYDKVKYCYDAATTHEGDPANEHTTIVAEPTITKDGTELAAYGEDIAFLEFGTGLSMDYENPYAAQFGFYPSSYSSGQGKGFLVPPKLNHFHGAWPHEKKLHWGQNPARGMYEAYKEMELFVRTNPLRIFK